MTPSLSKLLVVPLLAIVFIAAASVSSVNIYNGDAITKTEFGVLLEDIQACYDTCDIADVGKEIIKTCSRETTLEKAATCYYGNVYNLEMPKQQCLMECAKKFEDTICSISDNVADAYTMASDHFWPDEENDMDAMFSLVFDEEMEAVG